MSKPTNNKLATLTALRVFSVLFVLLSIIGLIWSIMLLVWGKQLFSTGSQSIAEGQKRGDEVFGGFAFTALGLAWLLGSVVILTLSTATLIFTSKKLRKIKQQAFPDVQTLPEVIRPTPKSEEINSN